MPEYSTPVRGSAAGGGGGGGFFIARVMSPAAMEAAASASAGRPRRFRRLTAEDDKENILPPGCARRRRRSPLPGWYPRTPLRDVTHVINALEMRRARIRAARAQQKNLNPNDPLLASPYGERTPRYKCPSDISYASPGSSQVVGVIAPPQCQMPTADTPTASSATHQPSCIAANLTPSNSKPAEAIQMLCSSMDAIEKVANEYLKKTPKGPAKRIAQKRTLMSMR